jgi:hypothetical protein
MDFLSMIICTKIFYNGLLPLCNGAILYIHHFNKLHRDSTSHVERMESTMSVLKHGKILLITL